MKVTLPTPSSFVSMNAGDLIFKKPSVLQWIPVEFEIVGINKINICDTRNFAPIPLPNPATPEAELRSVGVYQAMTCRDWLGKGWMEDSMIDMGMKCPLSVIPGVSYPIGHPVPYNGHGDQGNNANWQPLAFRSGMFGAIVECKPSGIQGTFVSVNTDNDPMHPGLATSKSGFGSLGNVIVKAHSPDVVWDGPNPWHPELIQSRIQANLTVIKSIAVRFKFPSVLNGTDELGFPFDQDLRNVEGPLSTIRFKGDDPKSSSMILTVFIPDIMFRQISMAFSLMTSEAYRTTLKLGYGFLVKARGTNGPFPMTYEGWDKCYAKPDVIENVDEPPRPDGKTRHYLKANLVPIQDPLGLWSVDQGDFNDNMHIMEGFTLPEHWSVTRVVVEKPITYKQFDTQMVKTVCP